MYQTNLPLPSAPRVPRSLFISTLAILSVAVALALLLSDVVSLVSYISLTQSPAYRMVERELETFAPGNGSLMPGSTFTIVSGIVGILLNGVCVGASVGLFLRKRWGRVSYIGLAWFQAIYFLGSAVVTYFAAKSLIEKSGVDTLLDESSLYSAGGYALAVGGIIAVAIAIFVTRKLGSAEVRAEFSQQRTP